MSSEAKILWIDNLRAISCVMVIALHVTGHWLTKLQGVSISVWSSITLFHILTRFCVPVFLMITGALLLNKKNTAVDFYKKRLSRVLKPFAFWTLFYLIVHFIFEYLQGGKVVFKEALSYSINALFSGAAYHMWYIYLIVAIYLIIPVFFNLNGRVFKIIQPVFLIIWLMVLVLAQLNEGNSFLVFIRSSIGYLGYVILRSFLNELVIERDKSIWIGISLIFISLMWTFLPVYNFYIEHNIVYDGWFYFLKANIAILSSGIFILFKNIKLENPIMLELSKHSFGIYFIHLIYFMILNKVIPMDSMPFFIYLAFIISSTLILSYLSIRLLLKIPVLNKYIE